MHNIISAEEFAKKSKLYEVRSNDHYVFWLEADPEKSSRQFLCCYIIASKQKILVTNADDYNIKSEINEYGGGSYWLNNHRLYFINKDNRAIYYIELGSGLSLGKIKPVLVVSSLSVDHNYADGIVLANSDFIAVRETIVDHIIKQQLIIYDAQTENICILDDKHDFYAFPRFNETTNQLLWINWEHPNMPWDQSTLSIANLTKQGHKYLLTQKNVLIDIPNNSLYQPQWIDNDYIFIVSEHEGENKFWNLYLFNVNNQQFKPLITGQFELALPLWQLATNTFVYKINPERIELYCYKMWHGRSILSCCMINKSLEVIGIEDIRDIPITYIQDTLCLSKGSLYFLANTTTAELSVYEYSLTGNSLQVLSNNLIETGAEINVSIAQEIKFTNKFGLESYGFFYEPQDPSLAQSKPPLIILCHGGPTGSTNNGYNTKIQYWTSRGFAVLDVNYSGSTTYGKQYRDRIHLQWGEIDVADCAAAAEYLVANNKVDKNNIIIRGSSAGGLIVLLALYQYDIFSAGCCYYPVSDLVLLSEQIHNFEKYYNEYLLGDLKRYESQYHERSPINFAKELTKPILLFHGTDDKVIPISHTRTFYNKIKDNNKLSSYFEFEQEGHGFRKMASIKEALDHEYSFYLKIIAE